MEHENRLSVEETARLMGVSGQFVREGLKRGVFPWGYALKASSRWTYYISPHKFYEHTGIRREK